MNGLKKLIDTMRQLRDPQTGCPWDRKQDFKSLLPYFFEELHEYQEVVLSKEAKDPHFQEELGDLLFQVSFHAQILDELGISNLDRIAEQVAEKLIERHPHVFDANGPRFENAEAVEKNWEQRKKANDGGDSWAWKRIEKIPPSMGALARAQRMGEKAASFAFDWENSEEVWKKVEEEWAEVKDATSNDHEAEEIGDLLFVLSQYCRHKGWNPETILAAANQKFLKRFRLMEERGREKGKELSSMKLSEMEELWQEIKERQG